MKTSMNTAWMGQQSIAVHYMRTCTFTFRVVKLIQSYWWLWICEVAMLPYSIPHPNITTYQKLYQMWILSLFHLCILRMLTMLNIVDVLIFRCLLGGAVDCIKMAVYKGPLLAGCSAIVAPPIPICFGDKTAYFPCRSSCLNCLSINRIEQLVFWTFFKKLPSEIIYKIVRLWSKRAWLHLEVKWLKGFLEKTERV